MKNKEFNLITGNQVFFFPLHLDSGNRGCEAITRGTIEILDLSKEQYIGLSRTCNYDLVTGLSDIVTYYNPNNSIWYSLNEFIMKVRKKLSNDLKKKQLIQYHFSYDRFLKKIGQKDFTMITGGDMLCYGNNEVNYITELLSNEEKNVILWGCSIGKENLTLEKIHALNQMKFITARESITYQLLKEDLKLNNVSLYPDPAFVLKPEKINLSSYFSNKCVGINLSNFTGVDVGKNTIFGKNIINLLKFILEKTEYEIVFVPHVFWKEQDDRKICNHFYNCLGDVNRIHILNSEMLNYCQIRYAISKCDIFIGARTHAMISAYSVCVPSLALGYSIKSRGIAKDLGMPDYTVVDYRDLKDEFEILNCFKLLLQNKEKIKNLLQAKIPSYIDKAYEAKNIFKK